MFLQFLSINRPGEFFQTVQPTGVLEIMSG